MLRKFNSTALLTCILSVIMILTLAGCGSSETSSEKTPPASDKPMAEAIYKAGSYSSVGQGRNGDIPVTVEFSDTAIVSITVGDNKETEGVGSLAIEKLPNTIIEAQSVEINAVSGATVTSDAILAAVSECITQAKK